MFSIQSYILLNFMVGKSSKEGNQVLSKTAHLRPQTDTSRGVGECPYTRTSKVTFSSITPCPQQPLKTSGCYGKNTAMFLKNITMNHLKHRDVSATSSPCICSASRSKIPQNNSS